MIAGICLLLPEFISARNAPVTTAGSSNVCTGSAATVPVTVTGFTTIKAITLRLDYDPTKLTFVNYTNLNSSIAGASVNYVNMTPTLTKIMIVWAEINALTLPNGAKLLDLNFTIVSGSPTVTFNNTDNSGGDCEYADENGAPMNDIPTETYYINATITTPVAAAGTISGINTICAGANNIAYTVPPITGATGYIWTVPTGGTIVSGGNSPSVMVNYATSAVSGNITVAGSNACGTGTSSSLAITINPLPTPVINGVATLCAGSTNVNYTTEAGMTNYLWGISPGGIITSGNGTYDIMVSWINDGAQWVSVNYTTIYGCTAETPALKNVTVAPFPGAAGMITGNGNVCAGDNGIPFSTPAIAYASFYSWAFPFGATIASGAGTNNITVNFSPASVSGNVTVTGNNSCGNGASSPVFPVIISQMPTAAGTITGADIVCAGTNGVIYNVPAIANATTYDWTLPAGAAISSGAGTNQIMVSFGTVPGTGIIAVKGTSGCGSGASSPDFIVTMIASQAAPVVTASGPLLTSSIETGNQWYYEGTGEIPGATGQSYTATITGWYWTDILGVGCPSLESNHVYVIFAALDELPSSNFKVYPVPGNGKFNVSIALASLETYTILVYDQIGTKIFERNYNPVTMATEQQIDIRPVVSGLYSVVLLYRGHSVVGKALIR